jgi:hypothetical protein
MPVLAYPGPEYPDAPAAPAAGSTSFLANQFKKAVGNASLQVDPAKVCMFAANAIGGSIIPPGAQSAIVTVEPANNGIAAGTVLIRFWMDGTWPSTVNGLPAYNGMTFEIQGIQDLTNFRFISADGNQHILQVQFFTAL